MDMRGSNPGGPDGTKREEEANRSSRSNMQSAERTMDKTSEQAQKTGEQMQHKAEQFTSKARETIGAAEERAGEMAKSTLETQKDNLADRLSTIAKTLHQVSDRMRQEQQGTVAGYVNQAANQLERFSGTMRERSVDDMLSDVEQYARKQPEVFIGGAFFLGLIAARFLKSSGQAAQSRRMESQSRQRGYGI
ncbi:MAG: hypothetical protein GX552_11045 [Chloroflexi bacterium]|jgi:ElaB/YqjD/DUF883 family membrane-anchored ribosome-binding protein|nr:hypothetical protein [Chloroflexota bacterium]